MDFISREAIIREMTESLPSMIDQYELEDIGVFEEEGEDDRYYFGFTIRKNGDVYMIHQPFKKNHEGKLAPIDSKWVIECDEGDSTGYNNLDDVFDYIKEGIKH